MFSSRKNQPSGIVIPHYEGLPGFRQDFPCNAKISGDMLVFSNNEGKTVNTNSSGATAYLVFWDAYNSKTNKFFESIPLPQSGAIML